MENEIIKYLSKYTSLSNELKEIVIDLPVFSKLRKSSFGLHETAKYEALKKV